MWVAMNLRLNILLIVLTIGLSAWAYYLYSEPSKDDLSGLIKRQGSAEYIAKGSNTVIYALNGFPQYAASAAEIRRFEQEERTEFLMPNVDMFNVENGIKQWTLTADKAEITQEKLLHLRGNVVLQSQDTTSQLQRLETERLTVDLNTQDISSDSEVKSQGLGFTTIGTGLSGNLKAQIATLSRNVKTYLEPTVIQPTVKPSASKIN